MAKKLNVGKLIMRACDASYEAGLCTALQFDTLMKDCASKEEYARLVDIANKALLRAESRRNERIRELFEGLEIKLPRSYR